MRRRIPGLLFETVVDPGTVVGGGGDDPAPLDTEAVPDPVAAPGEPGGTPGPETPEAAPFDPAEFFQTDEGRALLDEQVAARLPQPEPEQAPDPLAPPDPWEDDYAAKMQAYLEDRDQRLIHAVTSQPGFQAAEEQHYENWANNQFTRIEQDLKLPDGQHLDEGTRELAILLAAGQRPPQGHPAERMFDPGKALTEAVRTLHARDQAFEARIKAAEAGADERYRASLGGDGSQEPSTAGAGAVRTAPVPQNVNEAARMWREQRGQ